jgi:modulator of FtsH protease HflC
MNRFINEGKEQYNQEIPKTQGQAKQVMQQAEGYAAERVNRAQGDVARFLAVLQETARNSNYINAEQKLPLPAQSSQQVNLEEMAKLTQTTQQFEPIEQGRKVHSDEMLARAATLTPQYGIKLVDLIVRQIGSSDDLKKSVYARMIKERSQIAAAFRSYGAGQRAEWLGNLENERQNILSGAYKISEGSKGQADTKATLIYADAYRQDAEFFAFWRSIESYKQVLPQFNKKLSTSEECTVLSGGAVCAYAGALAG